MNCTGKRCIMQFDKVDPATCKCVSYCPQATPPKTNADRIRSMTDEELADILTEDFCALLCGAPLVCDGNCVLKVFEWLKQEVDDGSTK